MKHCKFNKLLSVFLTFCIMVMSLPPNALAVAYTLSQNITYRVSDAATMNDYKTALDLTKNSRYAGRVWADKSVFAYSTENANENWNAAENTLKLTNQDDGIDAEIKSDSDFLNVFSVLGTGIELKSSPTPLDIMFVVDVSGSMGNISDPDGTAEKKYADINSFNQSAIYLTVDAINKAISQLLESSPNSRFGIAVYGSTAAILVPMDHYKNGTILAEFKEQYGSTVQGVHYVLKATVEPQSGGIKEFYADNSGESNNQAHGISNGTGNRVYPGTGGRTTGDGQTKDTAYHVGHTTNPQAGLAIAMNQFISGNKERTWKKQDGTTCLRIPALIHLTDGQAADLAWIQTKAKDKDDSNAQEWEKVESNWNNVNWKYDLAFNSTNNTLGNNRYNASQLTGSGDAVPIIFQTLMTAAYYKSAVDAFYNQDHIKDANGNPVSLMCYSVYASDTNGYDKIADNQIKATIDAILSPKKYFKDYGVEGNTRDGIISSAYKLFNEWETIGTVNEVFDKNTTSASGTSNDITITINADKDQISKGMYSNYAWNGMITEDEIIANINYVPENNFLYTGFAKLDGVFTGIIQQLVDTMFSPVGGTNDLGMESSVTYMDPVGKYLNVKNVKNLLLFGKLYGVEKTAVYSDQWIKKYEETNGSFEMGWYKGDIDEGNVRYGGNNTLPNDGSYESVAAAWADGWSFRLDGETAALSVPGMEEALKHPKAGNLISDTDYSFYQPAVDKNTYTTLHMNPVYGSDSDILSSVKYDTSGKSAHMSEQAGVYALADLHIWIEHVNDYDGSGYDDVLYINVPVNMMPLRTVTVGSQKEPRAYSTNIPKAGEKVAAGTSQSASFPMRLFYDVGIADEIISDDGHSVDLSKVDKQYILKNKDTETGEVSFYSNYYSGQSYDGYITTGNRTRGDASISFSASTANRYYIFQKPLILYKANTSDMEGGEYPEQYIETDDDFNKFSSTHSTVTEIDPDEWYFFLIDYYCKELDTDNCNQVRTAIARKGSELEIGVDKSTSLSWLNLTTNATASYTLQSGHGKPEGDQWVLATEKGGDRLGDLAKNIITKSANDTQTAYNTALPTISANSDNTLVINNFLGNNGLIKIADTHLLAAKTVVTEESIDTPPDKFDFEVRIAGKTGKESAILCAWNGESYYELTDDYVNTNSEGYVLLADGTPSGIKTGTEAENRKIDEEGCVKAEDGTQMFVMGTDAEGNYIYRFTSVFRTMEIEFGADNTADVKLGADEALLFIGLNAGTTWSVTEKELTKEQKENGFSFLEASGDKLSTVSDRQVSGNTGGGG